MVRLRYKRVDFLGTANRIPMVDMLILAGRQASWHLGRHLGILASWHLGILASWHLGRQASWHLGRQAGCENYNIAIGCPCSVQPVL